MKQSHHYAADDVTIETWEPSLPRPQIKPGIFPGIDGDDLEMNERVTGAGNDRVREKHSTVMLFLIYQRLQSVTHRILE